MSELTMYDLDPNQDAVMDAEVERIKADALKRYPHLAIPLEPCPFCGAIMVEEADEEGGYFVHPGRKGAVRADCWLADAIVKRHSDPDLDDVAAWNARPAFEGETPEMREAVTYLPTPMRGKLASVRDEVWLEPAGTYALAVCGPDMGQRQRFARAIWVMLHRLTLLPANQGGDK